MNTIILLKNDGVFLIILKYKGLPNWIIHLELDDISFVRRFVQFADSLKDIAKEYDATYPTLRLRLDKLIHKINSVNNEKAGDFIERIKSLALDDKMDIDTAKIIISEYKKTRS